ncbi:aldo/keto reductase [Reinekea sp.]|jgi:aryl-alcohol dehydrogenase-like predicted oxidoreductase|uniref:aldo/keto reductase n=1 Tax=Reinekea sp. TaxID=1970455 RepID=UPI0039896398
MVKLRTLGHSGLAVSEIGLGAWQLGGDWGPVTVDAANRILTAADKAGVSFWDTADVYGSGQSEQFIGDFNQRQPNPKRVIVSKVGRTADLYPNGYSKEKLRRCIEQSRERLQVNSVDVIQLHCIPFDEVKRGAVFDWLETFKADGLIKHYGASVETIEEAEYCLGHTQVTSLQIIFNVLRQDMAQSILPLAAENNVGIIVRLGLASGLLSGKMTKEQTFSEQDHRTYNRDGQAFHVGETFAGLPFEMGVELATEIKEKYAGNMSLADLSLRWLLDHDAVSSVITGASSAEQIKRNAAVSDLAPLSAELHTALSYFYQNEVRRHIRGTI